MEIIKITHRESVVPPRIVFSQSGSIRLNKNFVKACVPDLYAQDVIHILYVHFARNDDGTMGVKIDTESDNGLRLRASPSKGYIYEKKDFRSDNIGLVLHLKQMYDWPMSEDKLNLIKYTIDESKPIVNGFVTLK